MRQVYWSLLRPPGARPPKLPLRFVLRVLRKYFLALHISRHGLEVDLFPPSVRQVVKEIPENAENIGFDGLRSPGSAYCPNLVPLVLGPGDRNPAARWSADHHHRATKTKTGRIGQNINVQGSQMERPEWAGPE
jgi:hypothetical protein